MADFTDMIERFIIRSDELCPKFDVIFIDEAQDLSPIQWKMYDELRKNSKHFYFEINCMSQTFGANYLRQFTGTYQGTVYYKGAPSPGPAYTGTYGSYFSTQWTGPGLSQRIYISGSGPINGGGEWVGPGPPAPTQNWVGLYAVYYTRAYAGNYATNYQKAYTLKALLSFPLEMEVW